MKSRKEALDALRSGETFDILVIGGGATGLGVAVDAASRGYRTALVEMHDFAKGTSSRSTKLVHGGVRYLRSGEVGLVRSALRERGLLERNAPHLVRRQPFVIPIYDTFGKTYYGAGLKMYELLSGRLSFGPTNTLSASETRGLVPTIVSAGLRGGVKYFDGQFDDARLAVSLAMTAADHGAAIANYVQVRRILRRNGRVAGVVALDHESGAEFEVAARATINATGVFTDSIRTLDQPGLAPIVECSSGVHLVLDKAYLPGLHALMVPKTRDGRVLFAVPWLGRVVVGTTDEKRAAPEAEPKPLARELEFLIEHLKHYIDRPLAVADVASVFVGLRPLVNKQGASSTASLSRDHTIVISDSGLVTITGGKWTTYRKMGEDAVDATVRSAGLLKKECRTVSLRLHGAPAIARPEQPMSQYGTDEAEIEALAAGNPEFDRPIHPRLAYRAAEVVWSVRHEMARTVEDILSRRTRALLLDARAAAEAAPLVAALIAAELGKPPGWAESNATAFVELARSHLLPGST
jgi:glycerol-3-phosphate dehydrogenase